jgi:organic hydroperoxide reductase OsmC/OhrA
MPHHSLVRLTAIDLAARIEANGRELIGGPDVPERARDWWLAEELLLSAIGLSLLSAFRGIAAQERLPVGVYVSVVEGIFRDDPERALSRIVFRIDLDAAASDVVRAEHALMRAKHACAIAHALAAPIELQINVAPSGARPESVRR